MCRGVSQEKKARLLNVNCHKQSNRNMTDMCSIHKGLLACTPNIIYIYSMYRLLVQAVCESSVFLLTHTFSALCVCVCVWFTWTSLASLCSQMETNRLPPAPNTQFPSVTYCISPMHSSHTPWHPLTPSIFPSGMMGGFMG